MSSRIRVDKTASVIAAVMTVLFGLAIYAGSEQLAWFDSALIGYATATLFLTFGVTYRYVTWVQSPPAKNYLRKGWKSFLSIRNFRRSPSLVPKATFSYLAFQRFIGFRSKRRWLAHQCIFWGCILAALVTFPLTFGWVHFKASPNAVNDYTAYMAGIKVGTFDSLSFFGWTIFHLLDISAVLVIIGAGYFFVRRLRDSEARVLQRLGHDLLPLVALIVISVTGLLLTFSSMMLHGAYYDFLALLHMAVVVLTLVFIPFGKLFHIIQRPASLGVRVFKTASLEQDGPFKCRECDAPMEAPAFVDNLQQTMRELDLRFEKWTETCPRCKRVARGRAYLNNVKGGFSS
jgi:nitrate reductase gamma subunit